METTRDPDGTIKRFYNGELHSVDDIPSVEHPSGRREWHSNGSRHRGGDQPAIEQPDGLKIWYHNDKIHRGAGLPAIIRADGSQEWSVGGLRHRDCDQPAVKRADGGQEYYQNGNLHRAGRPARIHANGAEEYYMHGVQIWPKFDGQSPRPASVTTPATTSAVVKAYIGAPEQKATPQDDPALLFKELTKELAIEKASHAATKLNQSVTLDKNAALEKVLATAKDSHEAEKEGWALEREKYTAAATARWAELHAKYEALHNARATWKEAHAEHESLVAKAAALRAKLETWRQKVAAAEAELERLVEGGCD